MKKLNFNYCMLITTMFVLASCMEKDVYDPNYNPNFGAKVPDNFSWSTTKSLTVNVEVNDEYNGKYYYAVRVYDKAPGTNVLPVAASSKVNKDLPFSQKVVVPATVSKLYISQVFKKADASEEVVTREVAISGEMINYSFGSSKSRSVVATRGNDDVTVVRSGEIHEVSAEKLKFANFTVENGGILQFTNSSTLFQCDIYIKDGGKLVANEGTTLILESKSEIRNYGSVHIYDVTFENGAVLYNGDAVEGENAGACFIANEITLINGHGGDKRYLGERSYTSCKKLILDNVKLTMMTSAWLKCDVLDTDKNKGQGASTLLGEGNNVGESDYTSLAMIGKITGPLTIDKKVLVECNDLTDVTSLKGQVVPDASGLITIIGTTCNEGGYENIEEIELGKYTYIMEDMYPNEGDYDMNDIVVSLTAIQKGNILEISGQLKAVGATSKIIPYIKVGTSTLPLFEGKSPEAHVALAGSEVYVPINTEIGGVSYSSKSFDLKFEDINKSLNIDDIDFYIIVDNHTEIHWNTHKEKMTWGMRVPGLNFKWAQEKTKIADVYPEFNKWFEDTTYPWYNKYDSSKIYK